MDPCNSNSCKECYNLMDSHKKSMGEQMLRLDALLVASAILAGVAVGIGAFGQRYRHRPLTRFIYLGATTLFLPIISYVVSNGTTSSEKTLYHDDMVSPLVVVRCLPSIHVFLVVTWAFLVQSIMVNTGVVVAIDDREGQSIGPPFELIVQGVWTLYLGVVYTIGLYNPEDLDWLFTFIVAYLSMPLALIFAKTVFKYYAFRKARRSFALGRNPLLICGYMQQLHQQEETSSLPGDLQVGEDASPPPLLVTGEDTRHVEKKPCGYAFKDGAFKDTSLVTIDRVSMLPMSLKDLCLSFALFKLLRCRFARYKLTNNAGYCGTVNFFWSLWLKDGEHEKIFAVIEDELSFLRDYYYSALPISYSKCWLPILSIVISLLSIGNCISIIAVIITLNSAHFKRKYMDIKFDPFRDQFGCSFICIDGRVASSIGSASGEGYGNMGFDFVPVLLLIALVVITEVRDMACYICSNWTKVSLIGSIVNSSSSQHSLCRHKWVGLLLRCKCKLLNRHWDGEMGQCSVLAIGSPPRKTLLVVLRHLLRVPERIRSVKVPEAVKVCIIDALRSSNNNGRRLSNGTSSLRLIQGGESFFWACNGKGSCDTILLWHIATCIFEVKDPHPRALEQGSPPISCSDYKIAATHLSRYCVYLVARCPELLPDGDAWIKSLYKAVKKDVESALAGNASARSSTTPGDVYQKFVQVLSANDSNHEVLKNGVELGKQLVETISDEETAWKLLAGFWSEMVLYVAPSDNLKGHKEAIARGGELITLLWALLFHAGIVSRPGEEDGA